MAIKTKDEIIRAITEIVGETPDDNGITLLEDIADTLDDYISRDAVDWTAERDEYERRLKENDLEWRKKYTERFLEGVKTDVTYHDSEETEKEIDVEDLTIDDLFEERKGE